jgi:uncharacterized protein (DUF58 family)
MSRLGGALGLGLGVIAAALVFGSRPLAVAGVGLLAAAVAARIWASLVRQPVEVRYLVEPEPSIEGERVRLRVDARRASRVPVGSVVAHGVLGRLGAYECRLQGRGRRATGVLELGELPRGVFSLSETRLVLGDHLGLESVSIPVDPRAAVVVHPRLVPLHALFSDAGRQGGDGRRLLLRRSAGFDFHSVREYEQGESLRRVHWPTSARRGQLMVKELEDAPRDSAVVLLDCDPAGAIGQPPDSSFDAAVRAAGSVLRAYVARRRKAALATTGRAASVVPAGSSEGDFRAVLDALAAVEPDALHGLARSLGTEAISAQQAGELVVVTAKLEPAAAAALLRVATRRLLSVVWVDAASFVSRPARADPGLLRLSAAGIPLAIVRRGEDLAAALDMPRVEAQARV